MLTQDLIDRAQTPLVLYVDVLIYRRTTAGPRYLLLRRRQDVVMPNVWQPACGKIGQGLSISDSFSEQVTKKTGSRPRKIVPIDFLNSYYDHHYDAVMMVPCAGAELTDERVTIDQTLHTEYMWVKFDELQQFIMFAGQISAYERLHRTLLCG